MKSNIRAIAKYHPDFKGKKPKSRAVGKITVKQNLFSLVMIFHGQNDYSNSETIFVKPVRTKESGRFKLAYLYENASPKPMKTDEQKHYGAGIAELRWIDGKPEISGLYWTNRNWPDGLNTAGEILMQKIVK